MTPGQAADVLSALPSPEAASILKLLDIENAVKIQSIIEKHEEKILNFATSNFLRFSSIDTVQQAMDQYRHSAGDKDIVMYLYIIDNQDKLLGVLDIRELLRADEKSLLQDVMISQIVSLNPERTLREASVMFTRYDFLALPILDEDNKILGVVSYRDMVNLKHRFLE
jgi:magnesium transporter